MPIYEFACGQCGARFERLLPSSPAVPACPSCGGRRVTRLISTFAGVPGGQASGSGGCACGGTCACGRR